LEKGLLELKIGHFNPLTGSSIAKAALKELASKFYGCFPGFR
jgi:hypothetical protein